MRHKKLMAMALAAAMMTGTFAAGVPALATEADNKNQTTISVTVAPRNTYTLSVPATTEISADGSATQLTNGITITNGELAEGKKLTVTASTTSGWKMSADDVGTTIGYALYSDAGTTAATSWEFSQEEANKENGTTKDVYAKATAEDLKTAKAGTYSDVITFEASVEDAETIPEYADKLTEATTLPPTNFKTLDNSTAKELAAYQAKKMNKTVYIIQGIDDGSVYTYAEALSDGTIKCTGANDGSSAFADGVVYYVPAE